MKRVLKPRETRRRRTAPIFAAIGAAAVAVIIVTVPPWVLPPIQSKETGPAAIEMVQFKDEDRKPDYVLPEALPPAEPYEGEPKASEVYENVQVLGELSDGEFTRLMLAITEWVSPQQGCEYCHNLEEGFASDSLYTKVVARQMLQMTRYVNASWPEHVAPAGVTCYTCHRGQNVPADSWYDQEAPSGNQFLGKPRPWYLEAKTIRQFFPNVPYAEYLMKDHQTANIQSRDPLVSRTGTAEVAREQTAEDLYLFMMQQSNSLGVNCTYCHNSRAFADWSQSTPYRWIAYWGIRMVREINTDYIQPLKDVFPPQRLGPLGDPAKANCGTCHRGEPQPLGGYELMHSYVAGLSANGELPDPSPKEQILLGTAVAAAQTGPSTEQPQPEPAPVDGQAIEQSVAPADGGQTQTQGQGQGQGQEGSANGPATPGVAVPEGQNGSGGSSSGQSQPADGEVRYESQTQPTGDANDPAIEATTQALPPESPEEAPPAEIPTGTDAPQGARPDVLRPGTPMIREGGTNDAPSDGAPQTGEESSSGENPTGGTGPAPRQDENVDTGTRMIEPQGTTSMTPNQKSPSVVIIPRSGG
ncbi:MAG: photosynthetic reaction center cytochrome c subunit [Fulvimarina manganoxydans]|uniref:photosynthetic reaction center cytochrome PufC n=1 Tax=Fulvimarina manganoxydans TaxID=937218 RepID=UPI002357AD04|nr:photosynthetic reaction center cytochrome PufC [Fulvimarina manganoxydans]MCK5931885.1 photosynthetic reaction center cytochrome c subunit [Fulvimarina manganoxydans]